MAKKQDLVSRARARGVAMSPKATKPQIEFMENLFNETGFDSRLQRNSWLSRELGREIKYLDEITVAEAITVIDELKDIRDRNREDDDWN